MFKNELKRLGLKDKEVAVYLACLELGPSPVQQISRKAGVVRATTYVVLDSLASMGLVAQYREGKKTLFSAEPPRQLMRLLEKQEEEITEKKTDLERLLPELQAVMKSSDGPPTVRYFDGIEGVRAIRREMVMYSRPGDVWYNFTPLDHLEALLGKEEAAYVKQRSAKKIRSKTLFTTSSEALKREALDNPASEMSERRFIPPSEFPVGSGMTVYRDRISIGIFTGSIGGIIVENEDMASMMRSFFDLAWVSASKS